MTIRLDYRVAIMASPPRPDVAWNEQNLKKLKALGFNTLQLNIAWGARPGDEPLNLEDVVSLPAETLKALKQPDFPPRSDQSPESILRRENDLRHRIRLCKNLGFHTIFHFGAPYNLQYSGTIDIHGKQPRCLMDPHTTEYYHQLIHAFSAKYGHIDDLLVYTYDQDAWLCNEFGTCEFCRGIPLHERVVPFINALTATWRKINPQGRLWWSPWELSAGQVIHCVELLEPTGLGLDLHPNIAETMATLPVDRWLKNTCRVAMERGIPVLVESYLGGTSEELEPYTYLAHPLVTARQIRAIAAVPGVSGIKEYYGLIPDKQDPNLEMTGLTLTQSERSEDEALESLAAPYAPVSAEINKFWRLCSQAQEIFPWDTSWLIREIGKSNVTHSMSAGIIRGEMVSTPAWDSSRHLIFMKINSLKPNPWMCEDIQLRCQMAGERFAQAVKLGQKVLDQIPEAYRPIFRECLIETTSIKRRALSYAYHLRETNLANLMRAYRQEGKPIPQRLLDEMEAVLKADMVNQQEETEPLQGLSLEGCQWIWYPNDQPQYLLPFSPVYFRGEFEMPSRDAMECVPPASALFIGTSLDNLLDLYVNGNQVGFRGAWMRPFVADISAALVPGRNILAACVKRGSFEFALRGFIGRLLVSFKEAHLDFATSSAWKTIRHPKPGWEHPDFSDTDWSQAEETGLYGTELWGKKFFGDGGVEISKAFEIYQKDVGTFLDTYLLEAPDVTSRGHFTLTSS